jgi:predicted DNA-binding transcriptional regulator AlpA
MRIEKQSPATIWQGLMAAKQIVQVTNVSRSHWHALVKAGKAPAPAVRDGTRFTRWRAIDIFNWVSDPAAWAQAHSHKAGGTAE